MTTNRDLAFLYLAALFPALIVAYTVEAAALVVLGGAVARLAPLVVNVAPAVAVGLGAYWLVARRALRHLAPGAAGGVAGHLLRSASLYVAALVGVVVVAVNWNDPDLGLFGQVFVWSSAASVGGIIADAAVSLRTA